MKNIIFNTLKTYGGYYIYDRHTNSILNVPKEEYLEFKAIQNGTLEAENSALIKKYQQQGLFIPNIVEKIEHPKTHMLEYHVNNRLSQLILQVTQQCNLRCEYCAYSGIYANNRTHSNKRMDWLTAKKAIDFFLDRSIESKKCTISFYGGEPLLEFGLIKKCIEYAESIIEGRELTFNMTTNGTLLKGEIVDFLVKHDCHVSISLDGSQEEHDINRKFLNGKGSFDTIINNIIKLQEKYPDYSKRIHIMTTINPYMDLSCVMEYFNTSQIFNDKYIIFNSMTINNLKEQITYDQKFYRIRRFEYIKLLFCLINKLDEAYVSPLVRRGIGETALSLKSLQQHAEIGPVMHPGGPCLPGVKKLFVRVDGTLYPCEKVSESLDFFQIGTLDSGLNINKMRKLLNVGKCTEDKCIQCNALMHCMICAGQLEFGNDKEPTPNNKQIECTKNINNMMSKLYEMCVLSEFQLTPELEMRK